MKPETDVRLTCLFWRSEKKVDFLDMQLPVDGERLGHVLC